MAQGSRVLKVKLEISDSDRNCYENLELSMVLHPSETPERLLARLIAYGLEYEPGLVFGRGLSNTEDAPVWLRDIDERVLHWIDVGQPDTDRLSKLYRRCEKLSLYCYGVNAARWWQQHQKSLDKLPEMRAFYLDSQALQKLSLNVHSGFSFQLIRNDGHLYLLLDGEQVDFELMAFQGE